MDFGLKTLTVIRNTCEMVKKTKGITVDVDQLPLDDKKTYDLQIAVEPWACSSWNLAACVICAASSRLRAWNTSRARGALSARPDGSHSGIHQAPAR